MMRAAMTVVTVGAMALAGCAKKTLTLPDDPTERAATCGVVAAASERETAGVAGQLSAAAQERILQYPMLAASAGGRFDAEGVTTVSKRMKALADPVTKGKWQPLKPACATAFPATQVASPMLPTKPLDRELQCYVLVDFMRKALGDQGASYAEAANRYGVLVGRLDAKVSPALAAAGIHGGAALQTRRSQALASATALGQPSGTIAACEKAYSAG